MITTFTPPAAGITAAQRTYDLTNQGSAAFTRSFMDLVQRNVTSGFELAHQITRARTLAEVVGLQIAYWQKQFWLPFELRQREVPGIVMRVAAGAPTNEASGMNDELTPSISDAKGESVMSKNLKKQETSDKKSIALAQSKVHRKTSGQPNAAQRAKTKKTSSGHVSKQHKRKK